MASDLPFYEIFAPQKLPFLKITDDVVACDLWFGPPPIKILATPMAGPISESLRRGNTASFEEILNRWRTVGNTLSDLTGLRLEPQTSRSKDERVTARPMCRFKFKDQFYTLR